MITQLRLKGVGCVRIGHWLIISSLAINLRKVRFMFLWQNSRQTEVAKQGLFALAEAIGVLSAYLQGKETWPLFYS